MKKFAKLLALVMAVAMMFTLAACGPKDNTDPTPTPNGGQTSDGPSEYATNVFGADVTLTVSEGKDSVDIVVSGMTISAKCTVSGDTLTLTEKTAGNDQIWARIPREFTLNSDGTATPVSNEPSEYATNVFGADVTLKLNDSRDAVDIIVSGMTISAKCTISGETLTLTEKTAGNDQIWARIPREFTLSSDGTAVAVVEEDPNEGGEEQPTEGNDEGGDTASYPANTLVLDFQPDANAQLRSDFYAESSVWGAAFGGAGDYTPTDSADPLFSWTSAGSENYHLTFNADGTYNYEFTTVGLKESGTWTWSGWTLTVTTANGTVATAELTK